MNMIKRFAALAVVTGAALAATPAVAATGVVAPAVKPQAKVTILKPLTLLKKADLNFGTILLPSTVTGTLAVSMSQGGVLSCAAGLVCSGGTPAVGGYTVNGTNNQVVTITAPTVTMKNAAGNSIVVTLSAPATATLPNSGTAGADFAVGGSFNIDSTTVDGVYSGDMNVTVDYQ